MPSKRKRITASSSSSSSSKKRAKQDDTEWAVREILTEKGNLYKISWAPGADGHEYEPTWEPKENVGWEIIEEWENKKKRLEERAETKSPIPKKGIARKLQRTSTVQDAPPARRPVKRTIHSSSPTQDLIPHSTPDSAQLRQQDASPSSNTYGAFTGTRSRRNPDDTVQIQVSPLRPSQLDQYEESAYTDFPSSQVISGTAPENEVLAQSSTSSAHIDSAASPEQTQPQSSSKDEHSSSLRADRSWSSKSAKQRSEIPDSQSHNTSLIYQPGSGAAGGDSIQSNIDVNHTQRSTPRVAESTTIPETIVISSGVEQSQASSHTASQSRWHQTSKPLNRRGTYSRDSSVSTSKSSHRSDDSVTASSLARPQLQLGSPFRAANGASQEQNANSPDFRLPGFDTQGSRFSNASQESKSPRPTTPNGGFLNSVKGRISHFFKPSQVSTIDSTTSSLPEPPAHHPDTLASAPARPATLSGPLTQMATESQLSEIQDSARIQELREAGGPITPAQRSLGMTTRSANRGTSPASLREARSPSMVPSAEVVPMPTDEENRTSERYPTLYPDQESGHARGRSSLTSGVMDDASPDCRSNTEMENAQETYGVEDTHGDNRSPEYAVPIFFLAQQRDHYKNSIVWKKNFIENFLEQSWPEGSPSLTEAEELVERLHQIISHPDLMNEETFSQVGITPERKAQYDKSQSAKILFLGLLFAELADQNMHIVIDVTAGRLLGILSEFLTGLNIQHAKVGEPFVDETAFRVTLLPKDATATSVAKANLVVGFEGAIGLIEDGRKDLRALSSGVIAPLIYLVVPKSVEHIERLLREDRYASVSDSIRMSILIENLARLRAEAGHAQIQDQDRKNAATLLARYLVENHKPDEWPLDDLAELNIINAFSDSQATTESELHSLIVPKSAKRQLDDEDTNGVEMKKARLDVDVSGEMPSTIDPSSLSLSLMTDNMDGQIATASVYAAELTTMQQEHQAKELEFLKRIALLENRLQEHISALESLQYRHEDQRKELVKISTERDTADERASNVANQMSSRENLLTMIKAEREDYKARLAAAEAALASHQVPEIAEFEALKTKAAAAEKEKAKLELRVKNLSNDLEYIRNMYQDVSGKGSAVIEERNELASQVADLEKQASTQRATALRLTADSTHKQLGNEIRHLRTTLAEREKVLAKREDEISKLREKERGRMSTRGGSVPRSPGRLGSPMRLEPPRMGSRAGSPMSKSRLGR